MLRSMWMPLTEYLIQAAELAIQLVDVLLTKPRNHANLTNNTHCSLFFAKNNEPRHAAALEAPKVCGSCRSTACKLSVRSSPSSRRSIPVADGSGLTGI